MIDDDVSVLAGLRLVFETNGHSALAAPSGLLALDLVNSQYPTDLTVLDFQTMGFDGDHFARAIMAQKPALPIIAWSESTNDIPTFLKWFADAVLQKADGPHALLATIEIIRDEPLRLDAFYGA